MGQDRALCHAGGAAGILQHGDVVDTGAGVRQLAAGAQGQRLGQGNQSGQFTFGGGLGLDQVKYIGDDDSADAGLGYHLVPGGDLIGFGFNWGEPNEDTFGSGLNDQYSTELFYRFQAAERLAFTGDVQWLKDPALNPDESSIWMFNLRARLVL